MLVTSNLSMTSNFLLGFPDFVVVTLLDSRYLRSFRFFSSSGSMAGLSIPEVSEFLRGFLDLSLGALESDGSANMSSSGLDFPCNRLFSSSDGLGLCPGGRGNPLNEFGSGLRGPSFVCLDLVFVNSFGRSVTSIEACS